MEVKNVMIAGGGTMGSQVAWQVAFNGFEVVVYDLFEEGLTRSNKFHRQFAKPPRIKMILTFLTNLTC